MLSIYLSFFLFICGHDWPGDYDAGAAVLRRATRIVRRHIQSISSDACRTINRGYALGQLFFAPVWGRLSDRTGRRPLVLIGIGAHERKQFKQ